jgi:glycogen(starch) synthase
MKASVVINTFNRAEYLESAVTSIARQTWSDVELIVVNGPSTDRTEQVLQQVQASGVRLKYATCATRNLSESRNIGIAQASGHVVLFIDDDAIACPRWVERLMAAYTDTSVGAAGGFTLDHTGMAFQCRYTVCDRFGNPSFFDYLDPTGPLTALRNRMYPSLLGTNASFRRSDLLQIGGFDEVFAYMLDETDVCLRMFDRGRRIVTVPDALVLHKYAPSHTRTAERIPQALLAPARSKAYFILKHSRCEPERIGAAFKEIETYRHDTVATNRRLLDRGKLSVESFGRLTDELNAGIAEGIRLGLELTSPSRPAVLYGLPPAFLNLRDSRAVQRPGTPLRIYFASQGYPPHDTSGIARWTSECARSIAALGHDVHVVVRSHTDSSSVDCRDGVWVHAVVDVLPDDVVPMAPVEVPMVLARRAGAVFREIHRAKGIWGVDIVSAPIWDVEGIVCASHLDVPVVTSLHTTYKLALPYKSDWRYNRKFLKQHVMPVIKAESWLMQRSAGILANSDEILTSIDAAYSIELETGVVPCAVVPHGLAPAVVAARALPVPQVQLGPVKVLFVGRLEERKGQDWFLESLLTLPTDLPAVQIDLVGAAVDSEGAYSKRLERLAAQIRSQNPALTVCFHGFVPDDRLDSFYRECDLLVATSRFESFGLILIEAMRHGKPVIASRTGGMSSIIDDGTEGYLIEVGNVPALAGRFLALISSADARERFGRAGRSRFNRDFTATLMASRIVAFFESIIRRSSGHG